VNARVTHDRLRVHRNPTLSRGHDFMESSFIGQIKKEFHAEAIAKSRLERIWQEKREDAKQGILTIKSLKRLFLSRRAFS
jgi:hypothetical protein